MRPAHRPLTDVIDLLLLLLPSSDLSGRESELRTASIRAPRSDDPMAALIPIAEAQRDADVVDRSVPHVPLAQVEAEVSAQIVRPLDQERDAVRRLASA